MPLNLTSTVIQRCFEGQFTYDATTIGAKDYITINPDASKVSVSLKALSTCVATLEYTIAPYSKLSTADWIEWDAGSTTGGITLSDSTVGPITAVRPNVSVALAGDQIVVNVKTQGEIL